MSTPALSGAPAVDGLYGAGVIKQLAERLTRDYGNGFSHSGLTRMAKLYDQLPDLEKVATLSQQLNWSHFVALIKLDDRSKRAFTGCNCRPTKPCGPNCTGRWSKPRPGFRGVEGRDD